jgi:3-deoxy-D-manno-octulosonic-acid transferase
MSNPPLESTPIKDNTPSVPDAPSTALTDPDAAPLLNSNSNALAKTTQVTLSESRSQPSSKPVKARVIIEDPSLDFEPLTANKVIRAAAITPPLYYRAAIALLKPLYRLSVWKRSRQRDNYSDEVAQRFGRQYPARPFSGGNSRADASTEGQSTAVKSSPLKKPLPSGRSVIWCHAVSLGETNTVAPLLDKLMAAGYGIWLTNTTQTGFARGESRFAEQIAAGVLSHSYVPVDSAPVIETFLQHVQPVAAMFVETELWAITLAKLAEAQIPAIMVNARLSESSFASYQKMAKVTTSMMQNLSLIIAQDPDSAKRFRQLGAASGKIRVAGSLKWVINAGQPAQSAIASDYGEGFRQAGLEQRPTWIAASTHAGEESIALQVQQQLLQQEGLSNALLIIVPRHPERFEEVATLIERAGLTMARRSLEQPIQADTQVYLADTMGELMHWYAAADVALVGGSLVDIGGHNPIEPLSVKTPVIMGAFTQSCQQVVDTLVNKGALYQLPTAKKPQATVAALSAQLQVWLTDLAAAQRAGQLGYESVEAHQSVLDRQLAMIESAIHQRTVSATTALLG